MNPNQKYIIFIFLYFRINTQVDKDLKGKYVVLDVPMVYARESYLLKVRKLSTMEPYFILMKSNQKDHLLEKDIRKEFEFHKGLMKYVGFKDGEEHVYFFLQYEKMVCPLRDVLDLLKEGGPRGKWKKNFLQIFQIVMAFVRRGVILDSITLDDFHYDILTEKILLVNINYPHKAAILFEPDCRQNGQFTFLNHELENLIKIQLGKIYYALATGDELPFRANFDYSVDLVRISNLLLQNLLLKLLSPARLPYVAYTTKKDMHEPILLESLYLHEFFLT